MNFPVLKTNSDQIDAAYRIAIGDYAGNILPFKDGLLEESKPVIIAGLDYVSPWTRDSAINSWFCGSLLTPEIAEDTLLSVLRKNSRGKIEIGGEYWDSIIWATAAWNHFNVTRRRKFLEMSYQAVSNSLEKFEAEEFDSGTGLFRGGACFQDGIAGYPDYYADKGCSSGIADWVNRNPEQTPAGFGLPMLALSTNCLFFNAYMLVGKMADELKISDGKNWKIKAGVLKKAINSQLWDNKLANYNYMIGPHGVSKSQEGMGASFAILFGIADEEKTNDIFRTQHITNAGIPCVWPNFKRYSKYGKNAYGRHCGTVWPQVQGFWALAAVKAGRYDKFADELLRLAINANRDAQFAEIYHPDSTEIYGGIQENGDQGVISWKSCRRQTWSATAFMAMLIRGLVGLDFDEKGLSISPSIPESLSINTLSLNSLKIGKSILSIDIRGTGNETANIFLDGKEHGMKHFPQDIFLHEAREFRIEVNMR